MSPRYTHDAKLIGTTTYGLRDGFDTEGGRWQSVCWAHGTIISHETRADARAAAERPDDWCEGQSPAMQVQTLATIQAAHEAVERYVEREKQARASRDALIAKAVAEGVPHTAIADALSVSRQRVYQIVAHNGETAPSRSRGR